LAVDLRVGIQHGSDDTGDARCDERINTRGRLAVVGTGFEGNVAGGSADLVSSGIEGVDLGVGSPWRFVPAFPHDDAFLD
jgi:hypothetical protein